MTEYKRVEISLPDFDFDYDSAHSMDEFIEHLNWLKSLVVTELFLETDIDGCIEPQYYRKTINYEKEN